MTGKTRKEVREQLKSLGRIQQAKEMQYRAKLLREAAASLDGKSRETSLTMAKTLDKSGKAIIRNAAKGVKMMAMLNPMEQEIIRLRYIEDKSWDEVCEHIHYSRGRAAQIERQIIDRIRGVR